MFILGLMLLHPVETLHLPTASTTTATIAAPLREPQTKNQHFPAPQNWLVAILLLGAIQTSTIFALVLSHAKRLRQLSCSVCCRSPGAGRLTCGFLNRCCCQDSSVKMRAARDGGVGGRPSGCVPPFLATNCDYTHLHGVARTLLNHCQVDQLI